MPEIIEYYGKNAGKIWRTLEKNGPLTTTKIMRTTGLNKEDFYTAVGWLAKENKISFNENTYQLKPQNYNDYIGQTAGKVWQVINIYDEIDARYLPRLAGVDEKDAFYAIGWLAREGKISAKKIKPKRPQTRYRIK